MKKKLRNFGFGRQLIYSGKMALQRSYGNGRYGTQRAHNYRWRVFCRWLKAREIRDARDIRMMTILRYGVYLRALVDAKVMEVSYAQNLLSTVNVVLTCMRGDLRMNVSPSSIVGKRQYVRRVPPTGLDWNVVMMAVEALIKEGEHRIAAVIMLARALGVRLREASMLNARAALKEAYRINSSNIKKGTKGGRGRYVNRMVPVSTVTILALEFAARIQTGNNLIPAELKWIQWKSHVEYEWSKVRINIEGLGTIRDLRAAYACDRYKDITGALAPAIAGIRLASDLSDKEARKIISQELGHGSERPGTAYVGERRKK